MSATERAVKIVSGQITLSGDLSVPPNAHGVVIFAHGSGSSRRSPRNQFVAGELQDAGFATLLMDLLTAEEERVDDSRTALRLSPRRSGAHRMAAQHPADGAAPVFSYVSKFSGEMTR